MFSMANPAKSSIEELVQESMFGIIKTKTGIRTPLQIRYLEFVATFKKEKGVIKVNSIYLKKRKIPFYEKISLKEIKYSGATTNEFIAFLRRRGAKQVKDKQLFLERI